jgi:hypothetical protein
VEIGEDVSLDLTPGVLETTSDPARIYLREMGVVPLLTREGEVDIAKRIERGQRANLETVNWMMKRKTLPGQNSATTLNTPVFASRSVW